LACFLCFVGPGFSPASCFLDSPARSVQRWLPNRSGRTLSPPVEFTSGCLGALPLPNVKGVGCISCFLCLRHSRDRSWEKNSAVSNCRVVSDTSTPFVFATLAPRHFSLVGAVREPPIHPRFFRRKLLMYSVVIWLPGGPAAAHSPAANVANITNGYNAEQNGILCVIP
jgi:hypothetical protein